MVTKCIMSKCVFSMDRIAVSGDSASSQCTSTCSFGGEFVQLVGLQVAQMYNSHANRLRARTLRISAGRLGVRLNPAFCSFSDFPGLHFRGS